MRKYIIACSLIVLCTCKAPPDYKKERQEVIDLHEQVMKQTWYARRDQKVVGQLLQKGFVRFKIRNNGVDTVSLRQRAEVLDQELNRLDRWMNRWMRDFETDIDGKTKEQAVTYFRQQHLELLKMDRSYRRSLQRSTSYLDSLNVLDRSLKH